MINERFKTQEMRLMLRFKCSTAANIFTATLSIIAIVLLTSSVLPANCHEYIKDPVRTVAGLQGLSQQRAEQSQSSSFMISNRIRVTNFELYLFTSAENVE